MEKERAAKAAKKVAEKALTKKVRTAAAKRLGELQEELRRLQDVEDDVKEMLDEDPDDPDMIQMWSDAQDHKLKVQGEVNTVMVDLMSDSESDSDDADEPFPQSDEEPDAPPPPSKSDSDDEGSGVGKLAPPGVFTSFSRPPDTLPPQADPGLLPMRSAAAAAGSAAGSEVTVQLGAPP